MHSSRDSGYLASKSGTDFLRLDALGVKVEISVPSDLTAKFLEKYRLDFMPVVRSQARSEQDAEPVQVTIARGQPKLLIEGKHADFSSNGDDKAIVADALIVVSRLVEREHNKQGIFSIKAGAVSYGGRAVLLVGTYGAGKSTISTNLCLKDRSFRFITGNRVFVDSRNNMILRGVGNISLRVGSVLNEFGSVGLDLPTALDLDVNGIDPSKLVQSYSITVDPARLGISLADFPVELSAIVMPRKIDKDLLSFEPPKGRKTEVLIMNDALLEFSERICVMPGSMIRFPDIAPENLKNERLEYARFLANRMPIFYVEGRLDDVTSEIRKLLLRS